MVIDSSVLIAILNNEPESQRFNETNRVKQTVPTQLSRDGFGLGHGNGKIKVTIFCNNPYFSGSQTIMMNPFWRGCSSDDGHRLKNGYEYCD